MDDDGFDSMTRSSNAEFHAWANTEIDDLDEYELCESAWEEAERFANKTIAQQAERINSLRDTITESADRNIEIFDTIAQQAEQLKALTEAAQAVVDDRPPATGANAFSDFEVNMDALAALLQESKDER